MKKKGLRLIQGLIGFLNIENKNYPKVTFRLSVIGFIGSIGFYICVLRDLGFHPVENKQEIETLKQENQDLKKQINLLIEKC